MRSIKAALAGDMGLLSLSVGTVDGLLEAEDWDNGSIFPYWRVILISSIAPKVGRANSAARRKKCFIM